MQIKTLSSLDIRCEVRKLQTGPNILPVMNFNMLLHLRISEWFRMFYGLSEVRNLPEVTSHLILMLDKLLIDF